MIILVCGYRRTGKDTLYTELSEGHNKSVGNLKGFQQIYRLRSRFSKRIYNKYQFTGIYLCN